MFCTLFMSSCACLSDALLLLHHCDGASGLGQVQGASQTHDAPSHNENGRCSLLELQKWKERTREEGRKGGHKKFGLKILGQCEVMSTDFVFCEVS